MRFGSKIVLLIVLVVLAAQLATFGVMRFATERSVREQLQRELDVGERVWERFHEARSRQLLDRVAVLAEDFGFREAVSSADLPTMRSALANAGGRIGADAAVLLDPAGQIQVELLTVASSFDSAQLETLIGRASSEGQASAVITAGDRPFLIAVVPVFAPRLVAWVGLALEFGEREATEFAALAGLDVSVIGTSSGTLQLHASSLPPAQARERIAALPLGPMTVAAPSAALEVEDSRHGSARVLALNEDSMTPVWLLLQASRQVAMAPFDDLGRQVLLLSALVASVALVVAVLVGRQVSRPVDRLAQAALRIQRGEYAEPVDAGARGELAQLAATFNQMQQGIAEREATILHQAGHDRLTGLPNRERAIALLEQAIGDDQAGIGAVLTLDIDRFREINDTLGHGFGDGVLVEAASRLRAAVRDCDVVARLGADVFLLVLRGVEPAAAAQRAALLADALRQPFDLGETSIRIDCSIGIASFPSQGTQAETLLRRADIAVSDAKEAHAGVALYAVGRDEQHLRQLRLIGDLRRCIERNELSLVYQPKVNLFDGRIEHAEALLRWRHPELGPVPPDEFIPLAERSGLIHALTLHVLDIALGEVSRWQATGIDSGVAINLSAEDLVNEDLPERVQASLRRHGVHPARLILEVTESAVMRDLDTALRTLNALRQLGIRIAIDDFGTGHSSLAQLKRLPIDELKIDKSFVLALAPGGDDELIVRSIIDLAHTLSMRVVAEGVETAVGLGLLRQHGCEVAQGYHFSRPLPAADFVSWVRQHPSASAGANAQPTAN
jgi:diguanylate cyclase (GGDEF)-like protein